MLLNVSEKTSYEIQIHSNKIVIKFYLISKFAAGICRAYYDMPFSKFYCKDSAAVLEISEKKKLNSII